MPYSWNQMVGSHFKVACFTSHAFKVFHVFWRFENSLLFIGRDRLLISGSVIIGGSLGKYKIGFILHFIYQNKFQMGQRANFGGWGEENQGNK